MLETDLFFKTEINLYYDLFVPENAPPDAPLLLTVHGYGANKRYMMNEARKVAPENFVIASIQAPYQHFRETEKGYRTGFGWLTDYKSEESIQIHHNFILELVEKLGSENVIDVNKIYLYGFSQACALNFRFAFTFPSLLRGVIGVCGGIPSDLGTNEIYKPPAADVFYLYAKNDEFYPLEKYQGFEEELKGRVNIFKSKEYDAKHEITDEMREDVKTWLKGR
jgi:predicted esterase